MLLKIGQLSHQVCLSIRTLHHYDQIGLLSPSVRTPAGHRLYNKKDIALLHRIQALKQLGFSLQKISQIINDNSLPLPEVIEQQIANIEGEITQAIKLKEKLMRLQSSLLKGEEPDTNKWLDTLALMNVYDKYLTANEIEELNSYAAIVKDELENDWPEMVKKLNLMMSQKVSSNDGSAKEFVIQWTEMLERLVGHDPQLLLKVHAMSNEPEIQIQRGITPAMIEFLGQVMREIHRDIFACYLSPEQMQLVDKNRQNQEEWPPLIAALREKMQSGLSPASEAVRPLAIQWRTLFESSISGGDPDITERLRLAYANEPLLIQGTGLDQTLFKFIRQAIERL
ncbi:MAG TPA: MerR family transcriptional regulator [Cellvibrio sp.]|nr:MerR family transcriptional regulator [Cellvibrio sp.]